MILFPAIHARTTARVAAFDPKQTLRILLSYSAAFVLHTGGENSIRPSTRGPCRRLDPPQACNLHCHLGGRRQCYLRGGFCRPQPQVRKRIEDIQQRLRFPLGTGSGSWKGIAPRPPGGRHPEPVRHHQLRQLACARSLHHHGRAQPFLRQPAIASARRILARANQPRLLPRIKNSPTLKVWKSASSAFKRLGRPATDERRVACHMPMEPL
jgi:hypothetical protein